MDIVFFFSPHLSTALSRESMNADPGTLPVTLTAANADRLEEGQPHENAGGAADAPGRQAGWDAYEVWRRFIREPRARRPGEGGD